MSIVGNFIKGTGSLLGEVSKCLVKGSAELVGNVAEELNALEIAEATKKAGEATGDLLEMVGKGAGDVLGNMADIVADKVTELGSDIMDELKKKPNASKDESPYTEETCDDSDTSTKTTPKSEDNTSTVYYDLPEVYEASTEDIKDNTKSIE